MFKGLKFVLALFALSLSISSWAKTGVNVRAEADTTVVEMADQTHIRVSIIAPSGTANARLANLPEAGTEYEGVDIINIKIDTVESSSGKLTYIYDFLIQPFDPGIVTFPPFGVVTSDSQDTTFSDIVTLKVTPVDVDSLETINPLAPVADAQSKWYDYIPDWLAWVVLGIAIVLILITLFILFRKRKAIIEERRQTPIPPYELAMSRLNSLAEQKLAESGMDKAYYTELVDILRQYLEGRFGINAMEMTSTQIVKALRSNTETRLSADEVKTVLEIADFVKFAKVRPLPDDNRRSFRQAVDFVESTKPKEETSEEENQTNTEK